MKAYLDLLTNVVNYGTSRPDRTGTGTLSLFGAQIRHPMRDGFPLLTTKQVPLRQTFNELAWFLSGSTNVKTLPEPTQKWWWPWASPDGDLGPIYGRQLRSARSWGWTPRGKAPRQVDQLAVLIDGLEKAPYSRRHILSTWNAADVPNMALPCCHGLVTQFYVEGNGSLSLKTYQRSADIFLGVPVNLASYGLLLEMVAWVFGRPAGDLILTFGDVHLYENHVEQADRQLDRSIAPSPTLRIDAPEHGRLLDRLLGIKFEHLTLTGYIPLPSIQAPLNV